MTCRANLTIYGLINMQIILIGLSNLIALINMQIILSHTAWRLCKLLWSQTAWRLFKLIYSRQLGAFRHLEYYHL